MTAKRVLLLDTGKEWGGGTNSMIELLKRIDRSRFDVTAFFYRDYRKGSGATLATELRAIDIPLRLLTPEAPPWWEKSAKEIARAAGFGNRDRARQRVFAVERRTRIDPMARRIAETIRTGGFDLIYMNNQPGSNVEGYLAAAATGVPAVQHCRIEPLMTPVVTELVNRHANRVICVSGGVRDALRRAGVTVPPCVTIHNGIDCAQALPTPAETQAVRDGWALPDNAIVVGSVGQLVARKRVADLIRAIAALRVSVPELNLHGVIVGEGREASALTRLAADLGVADRVRLTGFDPQPLRLVAAMDIFALGSEAEGLPRVILEAMLLGRPVVASRVVGSSELVVHEQTGLLYPCGDIEALAATLKRLATDAVFRQRLGNAGSHRVRDHFSIERYVTGVETALAAALQAAD